MTDINEIVDKPVGATKSNIILDATVLTTLMHCPRLSDFRFNHNLQAIGGKSNSLECGSIVHKFVEVYYGSIINGLTKDQSTQHGLAAAEMYISGCKYCTDFVASHDISKDDASYPSHVCNELCKLKPECGHKPNDYPGVTNTPKESEGYKIGWHHVLDTCEQYATFYRNDHWVPLETEVVKGKILYEDDEIRILWKAKLDLLCDTNQGIYAIDHKTMKQRRDTQSLNNQFMGQCLVTGQRSMFVNKIGFQTTLKPEEKFLRAMVNYSAPRLMEWQSEILPYYAKLLLMYSETGYFPPNFSGCEGKYGNCAFIDVCGSDPDMREETIKANFYRGPDWNPTNDDEKE